MHLRILLLLVTKHGIIKEHLKILFNRLHKPPFLPMERGMGKMMSSLVCCP
jgi:hypothetical protein